MPGFSWYGFVASHPHLVYYFGRKSDGQPDGEYLAAVRKRFGQWILDTAAANYDQKWLDYQYEIGRRHHRTAKNKTDKVASVDNISYRYLPAFIYPITATLMRAQRRYAEIMKALEATGAKQGRGDSPVFPVERRSRYSNATAAAPITPAS